MTISGFSDPACREVRHLLGVYVVGAIDPAERSIVDDHLGDCAACRDELAGLAGLPAMLSRVPEADVERLAEGIISLPEAAEPSPELLNDLLRRVSVKRRSRMRRGVIAVAAAAVLAAGGATVVSQLNKPQAAQVSVAPNRGVASAMDPATRVAAVVDYTQAAPDSTNMRVQVTGIKTGTTCQFWVVGAHGRTPAGDWTVGSNYGTSPWYMVSAPVKADAVHSFQITSAGKVLLTIPIPAAAS
jgi:hypothetical protein